MVGGTTRTQKNKALENMVFYRYSNTDRGKVFVGNDNYLLEVYRKYLNVMYFGNYRGKDMLGNKMGGKGNVD